MDSVAEIGSPAPDFELVTLEGGRLRLSDYRGRIIVLNFWSADCHWSQRADEVLMGKVGDWGEKVRFLSIASNMNESKAEIEVEAKNRGVSTMMLDERARVADLYGAQTTPHFYVIDAEGALRYKGALDDVTFRQRQATQSYLLSAVEALMADEVPDPAETPGYGCAIVRFET